MVKHYREPHCFVCGDKLPGVLFPLKGWVWDMLPRINFRRDKVPAFVPAITFLDGYGYVTSDLRINVLTEDTTETRKLRGFAGY